MFEPRPMEHGPGGSSARANELDPDAEGAGDAHLGDEA
jgi:hypothetical protein